MARFRDTPDGPPISWVPPSAPPSPIPPSSEAKTTFVVVRILSLTSGAYILLACEGEPKPYEGPHPSTEGRGS